MNSIPSLKNSTLQKIIFVCLLLICASSFINPPMALLLGLLATQTIGHPFIQFNQKVTNFLLQLSVVGLGFGMNVFSAIHAGKEGFLFTVFSIAITLTAGLLFGYILKIESKISFLISAGTAICGGSAIAALSPVIEAKDKQISIALGTVFILNSIALFIFPAIGHYFNLSQTQFGIWCAIAIHDTSSVVGVANKYGVEALQIATTVKLARALWIIPVALITAMVFKNRMWIMGGRNLPGTNTSNQVWSSNDGRSLVSSIFSSQNSSPKFALSQSFSW